MSFLPDLRWLKYNWWKFCSLPQQYLPPGPLQAQRRCCNPDGSRVAGRMDWMHDLEWLKETCPYLFNIPMYAYICIYIYIHNYIYVSYIYIYVYPHVNILACLSNIDITYAVNLVMICVRTIWVRSRKRCMPWPFSPASLRQWRCTALPPVAKEI